MDLRGSIPTFVVLTPGKVNDARMMDKIPVEAGVFYLMDRDMLPLRNFTSISSKRADETIRFAGYYSARKYPDTLRLVVYEDFETGRAYRFLTNDFAIDEPLTIAELYRERRVHADMDSHL